MKTIVSATLLLMLASCASTTSEVTPSQVLERGRWVDLTHAFSEETLYWPNNPTGFQLETQFKGTTDGGFYYESYAIHAPEHGGTHLDAPIHFAEGRWSVDEIPLESLLGDAVVIDVTEKTQGDADYQITRRDVLDWESVHGPIPDAAIVLFRTGWGAFYPDAALYLGTADKGDAAIASLRFPGIHPDLAGWMVEHRDIKAVGIDVASIDYGQSKDFMTHRIFYEANIPGFENVANLEQLPPRGAFVFALPMKIRHGSGGPLRIIAWVPGV